MVEGKYPAKDLSTVRNPENETPDDIFCWEETDYKCCKQQSFFYVEYCGHFKLNIKLSPEYSFVSQRKMVLHFGA